MELICPAFVVLILVYLKSTAKIYSIESYETKVVARPIYPGLLYHPSDFGSGLWHDEEQDDDSLAADMQSFVSHVDYKPVFGQNETEAAALDRHQRFYSADVKRRKYLDEQDFARYLDK